MRIMLEGVVVASVLPCKAITDAGSARLFSERSSRSSPKIKFGGCHADQVLLSVREGQCKKAANARA